MASRTDPEDVILSAWRSFFLGARPGRFSRRRSGDLWRLLASIVMHKLYHQARQHTADMRSVATERSLERIEELGAAAGNREPTPEEAIALADELEAVMGRLDACGRRILELRLQDETLGAIAEDTGRSERTVRRLLALIRQLLAERVEKDLDGRSPL